MIGKGRIEKGEFYRVDNSYCKKYLFKDFFRGLVWLERIEFINGEIEYTEDYIQVPTYKVDFMILEGSILTNY